MNLDLDDLAEQAVRNTPTRVPPMSDVRAMARRRARRRKGAVGLAAGVSAVALLAGGLRVLVQDEGTNTVAVITDGDPEPGGSSGDSTAPAAEERPRFLPAPGWDAVQVEGTTTASNIPLGPETRSGDAPWDTLDRLEEGDVVLYAASFPAGETSTTDAAFPPAELPLLLDGAHVTGMPGGGPDDSYAEGLQVRVDGWNIDVRVFYGGGGTEPTAETRAAAQEQLARLQVTPRTVRPLSRPPENACQPANLRVTFDLEEAAGTLQGHLRLRNSGDAGCTLEGVPDIELRDSTSANLDLIPTTTSEALPAWQQAGAEPPEDWPSVRLDAGAEAQAALTVRNWCLDPVELPTVFTRLPYHVDRVSGDVPTLPVLPPCEDPQMPVEVAIGPLEQARSTG